MKFNFEDVRANGKAVLTKKVKDSYSHKAALWGAAGGVGGAWAGSFIGIAGFGTAVGGWAVLGPVVAVYAYRKAYKKEREKKLK